MRRQKGRSQAVSHINNSLGRSQIGLKDDDGGGAAVPPSKERSLGFPLFALCHPADTSPYPEPDMKMMSSFFLTHQPDYINPLQREGQQEAA